MGKKLSVSLRLMLAVCLLAAVSCSRIEQMEKSYNFSHIEGVEGAGEWGLSLVDAQYSVADLLNMSDKDDPYVEIDTDGTVSLVYSLEKDTLVTANNVIDTMVGKSFDFQAGVNFTSVPTVPLPGIPFDLYDSLITTTGISYSKYELDTIVLKAGVIYFNISHNCPLDIEVELTSPNILEANKQDFHRIFSVTNSEDENMLDLSGCSFMLMDSIITMIVHMTCISDGNPLPSDMRLNFSIRLTEFSFKRIHGRFAPVVLNNHDVEKIDMGDLGRHISGSFTLYNPQVDVQVYNTLPIAANLDINTLALSGGGGAYISSLLSETPAHIYVPASTADYVKVDAPVADHITLSSQLDKFAFSAKSTINPLGKAQPTMVITDEQYVGLRASAKVPLHLKVDDFAYKDTMELAWEGIENESMTDVVRNLVLRLKFGNGLPLSVQVQVYFSDSNYNVTDSLFSNATVIAGGYDQPVTTLKYVNIEDINQINRILTSKNAIIYAKLHTDGRQVRISKSDYLRCGISAKLNVDYGKLFEGLKDNNGKDKNSTNHK